MSQCARQSKRNRHQKLTFLTSKRFLPSSLPPFFLAAAGSGVSISISAIFEGDLGLLKVVGGRSRLQALGGQTAIALVCFPEEVRRVSLK